MKDYNTKAGARKSKMSMPVQNHYNASEINPFMAGDEKLQIGFCQNFFLNHLFGTNYTPNISMSENSVDYNGAKISGPIVAMEYYNKSPQDGNKPIIVVKQIKPNTNYYTVTKLVINSRDPPSWTRKSEVYEPFKYDFEQSAATPAGMKEANIAIVKTIYPTSMDYTGKIGVNVEITNEGVKFYDRKANSTEMMEIRREAGKVVKIGRYSSPDGFSAIDIIVQGKDGTQTTVTLEKKSETAVRISIEKLPIKADDRIIKGVTKEYKWGANLDIHDPNLKPSRAALEKQDINTQQQPRLLRPRLG